MVHRLRPAGRVVHLPGAAMTGTLTIVLPGIPPGPNTTVRRHHMANRGVFNRWRDDTMMVAGEAMRQASWEPPVGPCRVTALFCYTDRRRRDPDNAAASLKPVMDGLVAAGVLVDDDFRHVSLTVDAMFGADARCVYVTVEVM